MVEVVIVVSAVAGAAAPTQPAGQPPAMEEFRPDRGTGGRERLPAAGFLVAAYSVVWIVTFGYFWRLSRRQSQLERELTRLSRGQPVPDDAGPKSE